MEGIGEISPVRTHSPTINAIRDVTLPQLLLALHSPLETWKSLDKVKYKSMELISMVNMDVARNGDNAVLSNTNGHLQKCVGVLSSLEEALTMVLLSPDSNLKFGVESLRNLGNGVEETDELSVFGAHGGNIPNGDSSLSGCQLGSTRSGLPYLERFLQNYIRRVDDIVCQIESQLKSSSRVQESRYASVVLQAHGLRPSVAEYLVTNLYLRGTGISSMQSWVAERINKLNLESQTFEQLMERDSGNSSVYMSAVQHENHRVQEELKALRTAERILQYLGRLERKEKKKAHQQDLSGLGSVVSNDWETFARFLTRIYTLINSNIEVLSDISPLRRDLMMEERKTWADFQRNSSREMRVLDETLNGNLLSQEDQQQSNFYGGRRGSRGEPVAERSRFQTPSWARGSSDPPIPSTRFADKQFIHYHRLSADTDRTPVSAFRRILARGDERHHSSHHSHPLHNPYCSNMYQNSFNEVNQLPQHQAHEEMPCDAPTTAGNLGGFSQHVGVDCQRDPYELTHLYSRLYSSRLTASNHHHHSRYNIADHHVTQPHEHQTSTAVSDTLLSSLLLDVRSMRQTMSENENYFRTIIDTLRIQQESISDLRRLVGSGNRNLTDLDSRVEQMRTILQHLQPSSNSTVHQYRREHPTQQHQYDERIGRATQSQSLYDTLLYSSNLDLRIGNNDDNVDSFLGLGGYARTPRDINLSPRPPPCYSEVAHLDNDEGDSSTMAMLQQMPSQEDSPTEELPYLMREAQEDRQSSPNLDDPAEILSPMETRENGVQNHGRRRKHRHGSGQYRQSPGPIGPQTPPNNSVSVTLNNQVAPGTRANNYWDNFKSYSHQNMLSTSKLNRSGVGGGSGVSPSGSEGHAAGSSSGSRLGLCNNTSVSEESPSSSNGGGNCLSGNNSSRRNSRSEKVGPGGKTALSANFVENIGLKKRNELGKQGSAGVTSPSRSNSSNSIPCQEMSGLHMFTEQESTSRCSYLVTPEELRREYTQMRVDTTTGVTSESAVRENDLNQPSSSYSELPHETEEVADSFNEASSHRTSSRQSDLANLELSNIEPSESNIVPLQQTSASVVLSELNFKSSGDP